MTDPKSRVRDVLTRHGRLNTDVTSVADDDSLYAAGLTSHASVNVMLALEDEFDVEFPDALLRRSTFESVGGLYEAIASLLKSDA